MTESHAQSLVRLQAARLGWRLWRNNVGVAQTLDGRPVRYGLANDSHALNDRIKSSDLVGWRSVLITPAHVGTVIAQAVTIECKAPGWRPPVRGPRELAQAAWIDMLVADGGYGGFTDGSGPLDNLPSYR